MNSVGTLSEVLMSPPNYLEVVPIDEVSKKWQGEVLDHAKIMREHQKLVDCYEENGVKVHLMPPHPDLINAVYARDFGGIVEEGYILGRFKEEARRGETTAYEKQMALLGIPCLGKVEVGILEGGDFLCLDQKTVVVGVGPRSDIQGVEALRKILSPLGYEVLAAPFDATAGYLHLDTFFNLLSSDTALGFAPMIPEVLQRELQKRKITVISGEEKFVNQFGFNVVSLGKKRVVAFQENQQLNDKLQANGFQVFPLDITEIPKTGGGIHCMTFPISSV